jgi:hypothetical protein
VEGGLSTSVDEEKGGDECREKAGANVTFHADYRFLCQYALISLVGA